MKAHVVIYAHSNTLLRFTHDDSDTTRAHAFMEAAPDWRDTSELQRVVLHAAQDGRIEFVPTSIATRLRIELDALYDDPDAYAPTVAACRARLAAKREQDRTILG